MRIYQCEGTYSVVVLARDEQEALELAEKHTTFEKSRCSAISSVQRVYSVSELKNGWGGDDRPVVAWFVDDQPSIAEWLESDEAE